MHALNLPTHLYGFVDKTFLSANQVTGWEPAILFGLTVAPTLAVGLTVMLECGGVYRQLPPHAFSFVSDPPAWSLGEAQLYDCLGYRATTIEYDYLRNLAVTALPSGLQGTYKFTLEFYEDGFSREPTQSKSYHFIALDNGRLTIQPGNRLLWHESSFTTHAGTPPRWLRRQTEVWLP